MKINGFFQNDFQIITLPAIHKGGAGPVTVILLKGGMGIQLNIIN